MDRFWAKVDIGGPDDCWDWTAYRLRGYGHFRLTSTKNVQAHRFAYELTKGPIPAGLQIDHLCRNPSCCNPSHLEAVTPKENSRRWQMADGRLAGTTECPKGHPYDASNTHRDSSGRRHCRTCGREANRRWYERQSRVVM